MTAKLHQESIIIDGLNASWFFNDGVVDRLHQGGVTAVNATIAQWQEPAEMMTMLADILHLFERRADVIMPAFNISDIHKAKAENKVGIILGFQDTTPIADNLRLLAVYYKLGVRIIQLTYNFENRVGFGCQAPQDKGLTAFGREVVAEMNRLGILIDLSHCGARTTLEAIELSTKPVAITHANASAQFPHPRNKSDEAIKACAAKGGVIGALSFPMMLTQKMPATINDYISAIDYLVNMVGVDHVGIGPDFMEEMPSAVAQTVLSGLPPEVAKLMQTMPPVQDFESSAKMPNVTKGLVERGCSSEDVSKIMGGNWLRLYGEVW